jgi:thermosome
LSGYPVIVLKEGHKRDTGKDAQHKNIMAAVAVAEAVKSTLGPKGMDKMLVDSTGDVTITNDGATILWEMDIEHPTAKMIVEVAKAQDDEVGDGTTTAVILAGELLKKAEMLIDQGVHPTVIVQGYKQAQAEAEKILETMAVSVSAKDRDMLVRIARTALTGKGIDGMKDQLPGICVDAAVAVEENGKVNVENRINIVKITGGSLADSKINYGIVLDKERLSPEMPKKVENAKIALLDGTLELKKLGTDAKIKITDAKELKSFKEGEAKVLEQQVDALAKAGANVVLCSKGIGVTASHFLAKHGIIAARRIKEEDMKMLALATGAKIIGDPLQATAQDLGYAQLVEERKMGKDDQMIFVEGCKNPKAVSIVIHGGSEIFLEEVERALNDALKVVGDVLSYQKIVPGGAAPEIEVAEKIKQFASTLSGRDQLAARAFANSMESIPFILAENSGMDPVNFLVELRSKHGQGLKNYGLDVTKGASSDMLDLGVVEPLKVKTQAIKSATEAATMVLRVDDVIAAKREEFKPKPGQSPHDYDRMPY